MHRGFVKLWRKSLESYIWEKPELWRLFTWCMLKAEYKEDIAHVGYQSIHLKPGQFIFGRAKAIKETGLSAQVIRSGLDYLIKSGVIHRQTTNKFSIISILNWDGYQGQGSKNNQQITNNILQPTNNQQTTSKATNKNTVKQPTTFEGNQNNINGSESHSHDLQPTNNQQTTSDSATKNSKSNHIQRNKEIKNINKTTRADKKQSDSASPPSVFSFSNNQKHFRHHVNGILDSVKLTCEQITRLPEKDGNPFNPYQAVQQAVNENKHPDAILYVLREMVSGWNEGGCENPWGFFRSVIRTRSKNAWEQESMGEADEHKSVIMELAGEKNLMNAIGLRVKSL